MNKVSFWISLVGWLMVLCTLLAMIIGDIEISWKNAALLSIISLIAGGASSVK